MLQAQLHENVGAGVASNPCEDIFERSSDSIFYSEPRMQVSELQHPLRFQLEHGSCETVPV